MAAITTDPASSPIDVRFSCYTNVRVWSVPDTIDDIVGGISDNDDNYDFFFVLLPRRPFFVRTDCGVLYRITKTNTFRSFAPTPEAFAQRLALFGALISYFIVGNRKKHTTYSFLNFWHLFYSTNIRSGPYNRSYRVLSFSISRTRQFIGLSIWTNREIDLDGHDPFRWVLIGRVPFYNGLFRLFETVSGSIPLVVANC